MSDRDKIELERIVVEYAEHYGVSEKARIYFRRLALKHDVTHAILPPGTLAYSRPATATEAHHETKS